MRRPLVSVSTVFLLIFLSMFILSLIFSQNRKIIPGPVLGSSRLPKNKHGLMFDLTAALPYGGTFTEEDKNFIVSGFKFHKSLPYKVRVITKYFRPRSTWVLFGKGAVGNITLRNVQREQSKPQSVVVVVNYYTNWNWSIKSSVTVVGLYLNTVTKEVTEESEKLPDISAGEPIRGGFCQKLVYFGPVDEVQVGGKVEADEDALVLIEGVKIIVGPSSFDNLDELTCNN